MFGQNVNQQVADSMIKETEQRWDGQPRDSDGRFDKGKRRRLVRSGAKRKNSGKSSKSLEKSDKNDIIKKNKSLKINLQLFAEKDIHNQNSNSLKRAIRKYKARIAEHEDKINNPKKYVQDWLNYEERRKQGLIRHWKKEINNFEESIQNRIDELKKRGDNDE